MKHLEESMNSNQCTLVPNTIYLLSALRLGKTTLSMRPIVVKSALIHKLNLLSALVYISSEFSLTTPLSLVKTSNIRFISLFLKSLTMLQVLTILSFVKIVQRLIFIFAFTVKSSLQKATLIHWAITPNKLSHTLFLSFKIFTFVISFIIMLQSFPMRLFVKPPSFILNISRLIGVYTLKVTSSNKIAGIMIHIEAFIEIRLVFFIDLSFIIASKLPSLLDFVNLDIIFRQLVFILWVLIDVNQIKR